MGGGAVWEAAGEAALSTKNNCGWNFLGRVELHLKAVRQKHYPITVSECASTPTSIFGMHRAAAPAIFNFCGD